MSYEFKSKIQQKYVVSILNTEVKCKIKGNVTLLYSHSLLLDIDSEVLGLAVAKLEMGMSVQSHLTTYAKAWSVSMNSCC